MMPSHKRLLVIDDEVDMCALVANIAEDWGFEVAQANNHKEFRRHCHEFHPNFIIMDLAMPDGDGIELLRFLSVEHSKAVVILMSGFDTKVLNTARQLGEDMGLAVAGVLQKPIMVEEMEALLNTAMHPGEEILTTEFVEGLETGQIEVHYQPKVSINSADVHIIEDVEALVRWRHPKRGLLPPSQFLGLAEQENLVLPLTLMVTEQTFQELAKWRDNGMSMSAAVNIAPELLTNLELPDEINELARKYDIEAKHVMLEITESGVMEDTMLAMDVLARFRLKGFRLSLDDFGTGFSSLAQLYKMPFSELKIDQSFVCDVNDSEEARVIVRTTVGMAHSLGLTVCAEGVEDSKTFDFLVECGCEKIQGYFISHPLPGDEFFEFGSSWNSDSQTAGTEGTL